MRRARAAPPPLGVVHDNFRSAPRMSLERAEALCGAHSKDVLLPFLKAGMIGREEYSAQRPLSVTMRMESRHTTGHHEVTLVFQRGGGVVLGCDCVHG